MEIENRVACLAVASKKGATSSPAFAIGFDFPILSSKNKPAMVKRYPPERDPANLEEKTSRRRIWATFSFAHRRVIVPTAISEAIKDAESGHFGHSIPHRCESLQSERLGQSLHDRFRLSCTERRNMTRPDGRRSAGFT